VKTVFVLSRPDILQLFRRLNRELEAISVKGELYLVGGAVMCLVYDARSATKDVDGFFRPAKTMREAAARVANEMALPSDWLNDAVKGFLSTEGTYDVFLEESHLKVFTATGEYLLAMKCIAARIGEEFHDINDIRFLLRHLNISSFDVVMECVERYYPTERIPQKTIFLLEELVTDEEAG
jgi:hypothetical protein